MRTLSLPLPRAVDRKMSEIDALVAEIGSIDLNAYEEQRLIGEGGADA